MPREKQKRGRRALQKRQRDDRDESESSVAKRRRTQSEHDAPAADFIPLDREDISAGGKERPFYGMLDEQEHEYFRNADQMLEVNQFRDAEERALFIGNVHKEADGKELKLACQQSGSRLLERLILLSNPDQLKALLRKFQGQCVLITPYSIFKGC